MKWPRIFKKGSATPAEKGGTASPTEKTESRKETTTPADKTASRKETTTPAEKTTSPTEKTESRKETTTPAEKTSEKTTKSAVGSAGSAGSATLADKTTEKTTKSAVGSAGSATLAEKTASRKETAGTAGTAGSATLAEKTESRKETAGTTTSPAEKTNASPTNKKTPQQKTRVKPRKLLELTKELEYLKKRDQEEVLIKDAEGRRYCNNENCDQPAVTDIYCRYHYLSAWKYLQKRKQLRETQYLQNTIQGVVNSMGTEALDFMLKDFKSEKNFERACNERDLSTNKEEDNAYPERDEF